MRARCRSRAGADEVEFFFRLFFYFFFGAQARSDEETSLRSVSSSSSPSRSRPAPSFVHTMARRALVLTVALALALPLFSEARGGRNGIPDGVVGVAGGGDSKMKSTTIRDDPNPACDVCRWAWTNAQQALADPETQRQVMRFAEQTACGMLPNPEADKCKEMAREYIPNAIAALESFDADEACGAVGFCPPQSVEGGDGEGETEERERETRRVIREALAPSMAFPLSSFSSSSLTSTSTTSTTRLGGPACPACRLALNSVKLQLEDPANQKQLLDKAHRVRVLFLFRFETFSFLFFFFAHLERKKSHPSPPKKGLLHAPRRLGRALRLGGRRQRRQALRGSGRLRL